MLSIGIVGLPNVGKSTLFNALTGQNVAMANYPFVTIKPNVGVVALPDGRVTKLAEVFASQQAIPATVNFIDIAGLVSGASEGEGLGNSFLANVREASVIAHVVRAFDDNDIQHVHQEADPKYDIDVINTELILADLQTVTKNLERLGKKPEDKSFVDLLRQAQADLDQNKLLINCEGADQYNSELGKLKLLSLKPTIYVFNLTETGLKDSLKQTELSQLIPKTAKAIFLSAKLEHELGQIPADEAQLLLKEYGLSESGLKSLTTISFETLGLQTFLTAGQKEARAWTIKQGWYAPQAAGVIHTDFEKGFIAADIISYDDLIQAGSWLTAKNKGLCHTAGRDYQMRDGDVVEFKFNL